MLLCVCVVAAAAAAAAVERLLYTMYGGPSVGGWVYTLLVAVLACLSAWQQQWVQLQPANTTAPTGSQCVKQSEAGFSSTCECWYCQWPVSTQLESLKWFYHHIAIDGLVRSTTPTARNSQTGILRF